MTRAVPQQENGPARYPDRTPDERHHLADDPLDWRRGADPAELARMTPAQLEDADRDWRRYSDEEKARHLADARIARRHLEDQLVERGELPDSGLRAISLATVRRRALGWLWPGYVPLAKLTIGDGDPGLGKSTVMLDLACRGSVGGTAPSGDPLGSPFTTLYVTAEDDPADTILPRVERAGGDVSRFIIVPRLTLPADVAELEALATNSRARLVIIDPLVAYLDGRVKANEDHHVRRALEPVAEMAARAGVAVVAIRHLNKNRGADAIYRGGGSIGFTGLARSVLAFGRDPDDPDRVVMASVKLNVGRRPPSLAFRLAADGPYEPAYVVWEGEAAVTAEELIGRDQDLAKERSVTERMAEAIRDLLRSHGGSLPASDAYDALERDGFDTKSQSMVMRAKKKAGVESVKVDFGGGWAWRLTNTSGDGAFGAFGAFEVSSPAQDTCVHPQDTTKTPKTPISLAMEGNETVNIGCVNYLGHQTTFHQRVAGRWQCTSPDCADFIGTAA